MKINELKNKKGVFNILVIGIVLLIIINSGMIVNCSSDYITHFGLDGLFNEYNYQYIDGLVVKLPLNNEDYRNSSIYDSNYSERMVGMVSLSDIDSYIWNHQDIDSDYFIRALKNNIPDDIDNFTNFTIVQNVASDSNIFSVYLYNGNLISFGSFAFVSADGSPLILKKYDFNGTDYVLDNNYTMDGTGNSYLTLGQSFIHVVYSNSGILCSDTYYGNFYDGLSYYESNPENFKDQNYLLYDTEGNKIYNNPLEDNSLQEDIKNGMSLASGSNVYLQNVDFETGTLYIFPILNNYQKNNADNMGIYYDVTSSYNLTYHSDANNSIMADDYRLHLYQLLHMNVRDTTKSFNCQVRSFDHISTVLFELLTTEPTTRMKSFKDIYDNGGYMTVDLSTINNSLYYADSDDTLSPLNNITKPLSNAYGSFFTIRSMINHTTLNLFSKYIGITEQDLDVVCNTALYHVDVYVYSYDEDSEEYTYSDAPIMSYDCDLINHDGSVNGLSFDNTYDTNDLNDIYDNDVPSEYLPTYDYGSDTTSSSSSGGNSLVNNDNDIINFNGNGEVAQELVEDLLPQDNNAGLTQDLQDTLNQNGWLPVVQAVFSFVPIGVWSTIEIYIVSGLGILAAFFVLRLILDLL